MKLIVNDDYFPRLSNIEINAICKDWDKAGKSGKYLAMAHRLTGMGYLALADGEKRDAGDYFCLAQVMLAKQENELG